MDDHANDDGRDRAPFVRASIARQLETENAELRAALEPFASLLQEHHDRMRDEQPIFGINSSTIYCGQLRRARALLAKETK